MPSNWEEDVGAPLPSSATAEEIATRSQELAPAAVVVEPQVTELSISEPAPVQEPTVSEPTATSTPAAEPQKTTEYYATVEAWRAAGSPAGTETHDVLIGTPPPVEPAPISPAAPAPTPAIVELTISEPAPVQEPTIGEPTPQTLQEREQELQDAIAYSEKIISGEVQLPEGTDETAYWKSVADVKAKSDMLQQANQVEQSYQEAGQPLTPEAQRYIDQVRAIAASPASPFVTLSPEGQIQLTTSLTTAEKAGVPLSEFEKLGFSAETLQGIKHQEEITAAISKYSDLAAAIRDGKIDIVKEAIDLGMIASIQGDIPDDKWVALSLEDQKRMSLVNLQLLTADIEVQRQSSEERQRILGELPPLVVQVSDGKESLDPLVAGKSASEGKLNAQILRQLGYDISDEELANWAKIFTALDQVKIKVIDYQDSPFGKFPVATTGYNYIDAVKKGLLSANDLASLGFKPEDINQMVKTAEMEIKLEPYKKTTTDWFSPTFEKSDYTDIGQALVDKAVTKEELLGLGYTKENLDKAEVYSKQGLKVWIPVWGTIVTWGVSSALERGMSVGGDVLLIVPTAGWLGKAGSTAMRLSEKALAVGITKPVGVLGRVGAAAKAGLYATEQLVVAPITFPVQVLTSPKVALKGLWEVTAFPFAHPLETAKGIGAVVTGKAFIGEPLTTRGIQFLTTSAIPEAAAAIPTRGTGVQRVFTDTLIGRGIPPQEADRLALEATRVMQIKLSDMVVRGEPIPKTIEVPIYENGELKATIKFDQTLVMRELGSAISSTPFAERIFAGAAEPTPSKVYFSVAESPEWTGVSARGYTTPEVIELGRGGAIAKDMRINRLFDPVSKTYRNSVELEMTTAKGTQLVTGREPMLEVLRVEGNVKIYPSKLMPMTKPEDIIGAIRASEGKQFQVRSVNFDEVKSLPKGSGKKVEEFVKANDIMVGGSAAERTWTDTVHRPEDIDLISLKNNAKLDAERLAKIFEDMGIKMRIKTPEEVGREGLYRVERFNPKTGKWEQVSDVSNYKTYFPDIPKREPITIDGIKIENPLEQAEHLTGKYTEYQEGVPIEEHRGHPKRLAWMVEKILDTPGGRLTSAEIKTLEIIGTRIDYPEIPLSKIIRMKIGGLRDTVIDGIAKVIPALRRGVKVVAPDGRTIEVPKTAADELESFIRNNPKATSEEINEVTNRGMERIIDENVARKVREGTFRSEIERVAKTDPVLRKLSEAELSRYISEIESQEIYKLHRAGRFTIDEVKGMFYSGVITSGAARAIVELAREMGDSVTYEGLEPTLRELPRPEERVTRGYPLLREIPIIPLGGRISERLYRLEEPSITEMPYISEVFPEETPSLKELRITELRAEEPSMGEPSRIEVSPEKPYISEVPYTPETPYVPEIPYVPEEPLRIGEPPRIEAPSPKEPYITEPPYEPPYRPPEYPPYMPPEYPPPRMPKGTNEYEEQVAKIKPGTVVWMQGRPQGSGGRENVAMWKILPPPYRQEDFFTMRETPPGAVDNGWTGKGMTKESLQIIGGLPPNNIENIDLGWARINIKVGGEKPEIEYVHDEDSNTGVRSETVGMGKGQIPVEAWDEVKAQGVPYEEFVRTYSGELVGTKQEATPMEPVRGATAVSPKSTESSVPEKKNYEQLYEELVSLAGKSGITVKTVPYDRLKDYAAMNPDAAKVMGYDVPEDEVWLNERWNTDAQDKFENLQHELNEMGVMEAGESYKQAHEESLVEESDVTLKNLTMPSSRNGKTEPILGNIEEKPKEPILTEIVEQNPKQEIGGEQPIRSEASDTINRLIGLDELLNDEPYEEDIQQAGESEPTGISDEVPATVVQSYIRRKKPKNMRDWWESPYYEREKPKRVDRTGLPERTYYGHPLLPPDLSGSL